MALKSGGDRCSFCGKSQKEVKKLVAGPNGAAICDECVGMMNKILANEPPKSDT